MKTPTSYISKAIIFLAMIVAVVFALTELGLDEPLKNGLDKGDVDYLTENWICTTDTGATFPTTLPQTLTLPEGTEQITLTTTLPEDLEGGDVLRYHTLLGWYKIYIGDELRTTYGNDVKTEKTIIENASTAILLTLKPEDAGATLKVETGYWLLNYLAVQPAPSLSNHRDLLMHDMLGNSTNMALTTILIVFTLLQLLLWLVFKLKKQPHPYLLCGAIFMFCSLLYYSVANTLRAELWGYPPSQAMYGDFCYYFMEFFLPVLGYHLLSSATSQKFSPKLNLFILGHTLFATAVIVGQIFWIANLDLLEPIGVVLVILGYLWTWFELKPLALPFTEKLILLPTYGSIVGLLLDYYKLANTWWVIPESWVTFLQLTLPFMFFFPISLMILSSLLLWAPIEHLAQEKFALKKQEEMAQMQAQLAEREYHSSLENIAEIRKIRHDITHHLRSLHALASQSETGEIVHYIETILQEIPEQTLGSKNFITDSFLDYYRNQCHPLGIGFSADIHYVENNFTAKHYLGILLGNALKNAFEAASDPAISQPFLKITAYEKGDNIVFRIENSYVGQIAPDYSSTKAKGRGFGLASIRSATEQIGGYLNLSHTQDVFTLKAVLPNHVS